MDVMDDSSFALTAAERRNLARRLIAWFGRSARDLPWRGTTDLYAIWISEVMLQQTQVATVTAYFERFLRQFPNVTSLAAADEQQVLRLWEGLGYYRRARQMHAAARQIATEHRGQFPTHIDAVRALPGIGRYTAGAILSIGTGARLPILEANTIRVLSRLSAFRGDPLAASGQKHLWSLAEAILPGKQVGTFNQALMELGSQLCTPKAPACERCPIAAHCRACGLGLQSAIPSPPRKTKYEEVTEIAVIVRRGRRVLLRRCQEGERWADLWDFPRFAADPLDAPAVHERLLTVLGAGASLGQRLATLKHGVTRFRITLHVYEATHDARKVPAPFCWTTLDELTQLPLSTTGRKIARLLADSTTGHIVRPAAARPAHTRRKSG